MPRSKPAERQLTPEGDQLAAQFERDMGDSCCSCHISPPCNYCVHPGNPNNLAEDDALWEPAES